MLCKQYHTLSDSQLDDLDRAFFDCPDLKSIKPIYAIYVHLVKRMNAMGIELKKAMSKADIRRVLAQLPKDSKKLDAKRFAGTTKWPEDPLAYQKRMRDEW